LKTDCLDNFGRRAYLGVVQQHHREPGKQCKQQCAEAPARQTRAQLFFERTVVLDRVFGCYYNGNNITVELKIRKFGNSLGVILPKEVLTRLNSSEGEKLFLIEAPGGDYRLTAYDPAFEKKMTKADDIMSRYRNTLRELAK
jgi:putative addiction module antidote